MGVGKLFYTLMGDVGTIKPVKIPKIIPTAGSQPYSRSELIEMESKIGAKLFGPVPSGHRREFFCLDDTSWIWHEEWRQDGKPQKMTVRYEIQDAGVLKVQEGARYSYLEGDELNNFAAAVQTYHDTVLPVLYHKDPVTV